MRWLTACCLSLAASAVLCAAVQTGGDDKIPPPSSDTVELERKKLLERVGVADPASLSKSASAKLARRVLDDAKAAAAGSDAQFVALELAWRCAVDGAEVEMALEALEKLESVFAIDAAARHVEAFKGLARNASGSKIKLVLARALEFARRSVDLEDFGSALDVLDDVKLRKFARDDAESLPLYESLWTEDVRAFKTMREWLAKLETSPKDPEANHYAGYYYCFERRDYERGLAHLAQSHLEPFKAIAELDNAAPSDAAGRIELARSWSQFSLDHLGKPRAKLAGLARARHWLIEVRASAPPPTDEQLATAEQMVTALKEPERSDSNAGSAAPESVPVESEAGLIGIGSGQYSKYGPRFALTKLRARGSANVKLAINDGLDWLKWHQSEDGGWKAKRFIESCGNVEPGSTCDQVGEEHHDVGVSGLALLAFLGAGNTTDTGPYQDVVARGIKWLVEQQNVESGLIGERRGAKFNYDHAVATQALCEAYFFSKSPLLEGPAQSAVRFIESARNPHGVWRYHQPPSGESDTSVTGWMVMALKCAEEAELEFDRAVFADTVKWIDEVTDTHTGRVGYDAVGSRSARSPRVNDQFVNTRGEAMTAVGLWCRIFLGQDPKQTPILSKHAELLTKQLPVWDANPRAEAGTDFYYWYHGANAMYQMGGERWTTWIKAMEPALLSSQRKDGDAKGSWDARADPWGHAGGRIYTTALGVLSLEVYFRYARLFNAR